MLERLPRLLLHAEGLAVFAAAISLYFRADYQWWLLLALALAPDLSMMGYAAGTRVGAAAYNSVHTYVLPVGLGVAGVLADNGLATKLALVWFAHIGADRALGYGLKYPTRFQETHLQRV
jgi:Domain of unknown function (DUF4260)